MELNYKTATEAFRDDLQALIDRHWPAIGPTEDDELSVDDRVEMGDTYPSAWVLVLAASSIANPEASHISTRYTAKGQLPFTGIGLVEDALAAWKG